MSLCSVNTSSFIFGIAEDALGGQDFVQLVQLGLDLAGFEGLGLLDEPLQAGDVVAEHGRIDRQHLVFQLGDDLLLLFFGQVVEIVGKAAVDLLAAVRIGIVQDLLPAIAHPLQGPTHGVDRRRHAALEHRHRESDCPATGRFFLGRRDGLIFDVAGQFVVEIEFVAAQVKGGRADFALGEQLADLARLGIGEGDQGFLGPPQVEGGFLPPHRLLEALDAAVDIGVKQCQEPAEVFGVAFVRRGRHQQEVIGHLRQRLAQAVGVGLVLLAPGAHLVGLVHDDQIPSRPQQAFPSVLDERDPGDGRDRLIVVLPGILAVVGPQQAAGDDLELLAELVGHFPLPLEGQVRRSDDQRPLDQAAGLEFLEGQPAHDGLAGAGIVRQQEPDAGQPQEIAVDRLQLVRQRIDAGDGEREVGVVLVGQAQPVGFDAQPEQPGIAVKGLALGGDGQLGKLLRAQHRVMRHPRLHPAADDLQRIAHRDRGQNLDGFGQGRPLNDAAGMDGGCVHNGDEVDVGRLLVAYYRGFRFGFVPDCWTCRSSESRSLTLYSR